MTYFKTKFSTRTNKNTF